MKLLSFVVVLAAIGCGDPGSVGGDAGADPATLCRPPAGCVALPFLASDPNLCTYACTNGDRVCVPVVDGRVVDPLAVRPTNGVAFSAIAAAPYAANLSNDPRNCGACGNACPAAARYCVRGACSTTP